MTDHSTNLTLDQVAARAIEIVVETLAKLHRPIDS